MAADHEFHGSVSVQAGSEADHVLRKDQIDALIAFVANRANHTGTQNTDTINGLTAFVNNLINGVIGAAPEALNTLQEIADALGDDPNFAATINGLITSLSSRVGQLETAVGGGVGSYATTVGDAVASSFTVTHNLNGKVRVEVVRLSDGQTVYPVIKRPGGSLTSISVDFGSFVPPNASHEVLVSKVGA